MPRLIRFPNPSDATNEGLVAAGGDLETDTLLEAYRQGIFPWPVAGIKPMLWFCPPERAILDFKRLHVARSLAKISKRAPFRLSIDEDFAAGISACAATPRAHERGTWITRQMIRAYCRFHEEGHAHSVEAWEGTELVGGLYGVDVDGVFTGESMFYRRPYASKLALLFLIEHLAARGLDWIDIQVLTPHMEALGAHVISREAFLRRLSATRQRGLRIF